jgi:hypothetical protein
MKDKISDHRWAINLEEGEGHLVCLDPCAMPPEGHYEDKDGNEVFPEPGPTEGNFLYQISSEYTWVPGELEEGVEYSYDEKSGATCWCSWVFDDGYAEYLEGTIEVELGFDSHIYPSGPWGPEEYDASCWIENVKGLVDY